MRYVSGLRWRILALMLVGTIIVYVDRNVLGVLAPILKKELNFTTEQYSFVVSSFQIVYSFSQPVAGYLTDLIGPRHRLCRRALWSGARRARCTPSRPDGFRWPASARCSALSEAVAIPTGTKTSTIWFPSNERSIATGWFNSGSSHRRRDHAARGGLALRRPTAGSPPSS